MQTNGREIQNTRASFNESCSLIQRIQKMISKQTGNKKLANERTKERRITGVTWGWELNRRRNKEWGNNTGFRTNRLNEGGEVQLWWGRKNSGDRAGLMNQTEHRCGENNQAAEEHKKTGGKTLMKRTHNETKATEPGNKPDCHDLHEVWRCLCADVTERGSRCVTRHAVDPLTSMDNWPVNDGSRWGQQLDIRPSCVLLFPPCGLCADYDQVKRFSLGWVLLWRSAGEFLSLLTSADRVV